MKALKRKWNSNQGASILIALLFMLVCMMVGASIIMASTANAGKVKSNRDEQQKYLTLSSALNLVKDELESVKYAGQYSYTTKECPGEGTDGEGNTIYEHDYHHSYTRKTVTDCGSTWIGGDGSVLPLLNDLEHIFAGNFTEDRKGYIIGYVPIDEYDGFTPNDVTPGSGSYSLELMVNVDEDERDIYGELFLQTVSVKVEFDAVTGVITLTARLRDDPDFYAMEAVLNPIDDDSKDPIDDLGKWLALKNHSVGSGNDKTGTVSWTLDHIAKIEVVSS